MSAALYKFLLLICAPALFCSCIELTEEIHIHDDLSGNLTLTLEPDKTTSGWVHLLGLTEAIPFPSDKEVDRYLQRLRLQPGISNVEYSKSNRGTGIRIALGFSDYKSLSQAMMQTFDIKTPFPAYYIKIKKHRITRRNFSPIIAKYLKGNMEKNVPFNALDLTSYTLIIHPPGSVVKAKCANCIVTEDKATVVSSEKIGRIVKNKTSTAFRVRWR